ncbi:PqqD family peptide modification chaperone [Dysgonomonas reticulitermitis]
MKIKEGHTIKTIGGERVVIVQGRTGMDLTKIISFNAMAEWLWNTFSDIDFTENEVADILVKQYGIDAGQAVADARQWIIQLSEVRLLEL